MKRLWEAAQAANQGLIDADLGGGVIKQRLARSGEGKSGGARTIILFRHGSRALYVYGFEKKDRGNITRNELDALRELAAILPDYSSAEIEREVKAGVLQKLEEPQELADAKTVSE